MAKTLAVVKLKTFFSLLSKIEARIDTLANRLTDVEIKRLGETVGPNIRKSALQKIGLRAGKDGCYDS